MRGHGSAVLGVSAGCGQGLGRRSRRRDRPMLPGCYERSCFDSIGREWLRQCCRGAMCWLAGRPFAGPPPRTSTAPGESCLSVKAVEDAADGLTTTRVITRAIRAETARLGSSIIKGAYLSGRRFSKCREDSPDRGFLTRRVVGRGTSPGAKGVVSPHDHAITIRCRGCVSVHWTLTTGYVATMSRVQGDSSISEEFQSVVLTLHSRRVLVGVAGSWQHFFHRFRVGPGATSSYVCDPTGCLARGMCGARQLRVAQFEMIIAHSPHCGGGRLATRDPRRLPNRR